MGKRNLVQSCAGLHAKFLRLSCFHYSLTAWPGSFYLFFTRQTCLKQVYRNQHQTCFPANYDWLPPGPRKQASGFLVDLLAYLQSTFLNFSSLQVSRVSLILSLLKSLIVLLSSD